MLEVAVVITEGDVAAHFHLPPGRSSGSIPDTRDLWEVLWSHREELTGVAHTHPGGGAPRPSWEDLTTFAGCEAGLGKRLVWWIATRDAMVAFRWTGPSKHDYAGEPVECDVLPHTHWLHQLRALTYGENDGR